MTNMYAFGLKRALDVFLAIVLIIILAPLMLLIFLLCAGCIGRPVLFSQKRSGIHGKPFILYKFRTMTHNDNEPESPWPETSRVTKTGRILRNTGLDELPQLVNVLKGEMSVVGPRPLLTRYLNRYSPEQMRRHQVKPGITGWAQINGRNRITWEEKFSLDIWYVEHLSFRLDVNIILRTIVYVARNHNMWTAEQKMMSELKGTSRE